MPTGDNLGGTGRGGLRGLATVSPTNVWAVGRSPGLTTLIEHWDGTSWTISPTPGTHAGLNAVTALSATNIWAVGDPLTNADGTKTALIMHYDGTSWQAVPNPVSVPATSTHNGLTSITATGPNDIWALGTVTDRLGVSALLIQHWNGTTWSRVTAPAAPAGAPYQPPGTAARTGTDGYAVGSLGHNDPSGSDSVILHWDGAAWSFVTVPDTPAMFDELSAVTVTPGGPIWAVGQSENPGVCYGVLVDTTLILKHP